MLEKTSKQFFPVADPGLFAAVSSVLTRETQVQLHQTGPNEWTGRTQNTRYLCFYRLTLSLLPSHTGGVTVEVRGDVEPATGGIVLLVLGWISCALPGALLLLLAYLDFDKWLGDAIRAAWGAVGRTP